MKHLLNINSLSKKIVDNIFDRVERQQYNNQGWRRCLRHKVICNLVFEDSDKSVSAQSPDNLSVSGQSSLLFNTATIKLGGLIVNCNPTINPNDYKNHLNKITNSISKYADAIVLRHNDTKLINECVNIPFVPIISAGVGYDMHPSKALTDLYTIKQLHNIEEPITKLNIGFTHNLDANTNENNNIKAVIKLLDRYLSNVNFHFISTNINNNSNINNTFIEELNNNCYWSHKLTNIISDLDILYINSTEWDLKEKKLINQLSQTKDKLTILTPLSLVDSIDNKMLLSILPNHRCKYLNQMRNALYLRMAILEYVLENPINNTH